MAETLEKIPPIVEGIIRSAIDEILVGIPVSGFTIEAERDHTGDEAISVQICHPPLVHGFDPRLETDLLVTVHRRMIEVGELRFPYISHHYAE